MLVGKVSFDNFKSLHVIVTTAAFKELLQSAPFNVVKGALKSIAAVTSNYNEVFHSLQYTLVQVLLTLCTEMMNHHGGRAVRPRRSQRISATRWLDCFFNFWPLTTTTIFPIPKKYSKEVSNFCPMLNQHGNKCQRLLKFCPSGEFSPNLVTLLTIKIVQN